VSSWRAPGSAGTPCLAAMGAWLASCTSPGFRSSPWRHVLVYGRSPSTKGMIALTELLNHAQPAADDTSAETAEPAPTAVERCTTETTIHHPAIIALVPLLARQAAQEHVAAKVARHG
jgi:hypothetical protein